MPFDITGERTFSAAHQIRLYDGSLEPLHAHSWRVRLTVSAPALDSIGLVMDFHKLERLLDAVLAPCHDRSLNDLPPFASTNPSAENLALHIATSLTLPPGITLASVEVWETPTNSAIYRPSPLTP